MSPAEWASLNGAAAKAVAEAASERGAAGIGEAEPGPDREAPGKEASMRFPGCPGWLWGVWWEPKPEWGEGAMRGRFFGFYEELIDKFRPSRAELSAELAAWPDGSRPGGWDVDAWGAGGQVAFAAKEPALAFCRDWLGWDYDEEYRTREEAEAEFARYGAEKAEAERSRAAVEAMALRALADAYGAELSAGSAAVLDEGEGSFPRFAVAADADAAFGGALREGGPGTYCLGDVDPEARRRLRMAEAEAMGEGAPWPASGCFLAMPGERFREELGSPEAKAGAAALAKAAAEESADPLDARPGDGYDGGEARECEDSDAKGGK